MTNGIIDSGQEIVTNGLVLHLDAAQRRSYSGTGTTWRDLSGNSNNGTLTNGPTFNSANGGSIQFDGVDDIVNCGNVTQLNSINITVSCWVKPLRSTTNNIFFSRYYNGSPDNGFMLSYGNLTFSFSGRENASAYLSISTQNIYSLNNWYHITGVKESNIWKIFVNGVLVTSASLGLGNISFLTNSTQIGGINNSGSIIFYSQSQISNVQAYNRALSNAEILQNYNATKARFEVPALLDLYPNAAAAYSLRKLRSGYTGSAIRVRRSSDNTEQDIGFTSTGDLDTTALTTFVGTGNTGFVTTWYDQSENNNHATQSTTANQPVIFSAGAIISENTKPSIYFNNGNTVCLNLTSTINTNPFTILWVSKKDNITAQQSIILSGARNGNQYMGDDVDNQGLPNAYTANTPINGIIRATLSNTNPSSNDKILQHLSYLNRKNFTQAVGQYNNSTNSYNNNVSSTSAIIDSIANYGVNYNYVGKIQEIIIYSSDKSENRQGISENINSYYGIYNPTVVTMDTDAQAFITAAGITDLVQQGAINTLVKTLKDVNLWSKMKAIYPFVGGTANSHKFNLKDPRDVDAAFRLVFFNTWTHNSNGVQGNGTNTYANSFFNPTLNVSVTNAHVTIYLRTNSGGPSQGLFTSASDFGAINDNFGIGKYNAGVDMRGYIGSALGNPAFAASNNSLGLWAVSALNNRIQKLYLNGLNISSVTANQNLPNYPVFLGAGNYGTGGVQLYTAYQFAFATIGDGLTDTEAANLYSVVQTFQATLGRQV